MNIESHVYGWMKVASQVAFYKEYPFSSVEERDDILSWYESENYTYVIHKDRIEVRGWPVAEWNERLAQSGHTDDVDDVSFCPEMPWDMGTTAMVEFCHKLYPSIDTTPFVVFARIAESQYEHESGGDPQFWPDRKQLLAEAYQRAEDVAQRILIVDTEVVIHRIMHHFKLDEYMGTRKEHWQTDQPENNISRVSVDQSSRMITIAAGGNQVRQEIGPLEPHEVAYIQALVDAKLNGKIIVSSTFLKTIPIAEGRNIERDFNGSPTQRVASCSASETIRNGGGQVPRSERSR